MYQKVDSQLNFLDREREVLAFWREKQIFERSNDGREDAPKFTFYDGPPTANGKPHIGHILTRVIKDVIPRYHAMLGKNVMRKAGWDTHGLPVELEVEKLLGIDGKEQIEAFGIEPFIRQCKESVWKYKKEWEDMSERVGFWADMAHPYVTYENDYIESEWWALRKIWDNRLLYKGFKIVPYCPRCGTALSSHEVAQGYRDVKDVSAFVRFKVQGEADTYIAAWTTTPWTLPSNVALCVNPDEDYVLAQVDRDLDGSDKPVRYYLAKALCQKILGETATVLRTMKGSELEQLNYEPLLPYANNTVQKSGKRGFYVISDAFVTLTDGTGVVHIAPAFGEDDARLGRAFDLPFVQLVEPDGRLSAEVTDFAGQFVKDADPGILEKLQADKLLMGTDTYEHNYPFCWRCDTPLIYYARNSWFIEMTKLRDQLLQNNATVNWYPPAIGSGRFGHFLENVVDWSISRERYWGTPLPIWQCTCGHQHLVGSIAELQEMSPNCPPDIELHRPYIDEVLLTCPECSGQMTRVPEVIDCWFDSGAMPFAQWHYPFENKEAFEARFPAHFISEALDQTRGWFYSLMAISTLLFDESPFMNCIVMGLVQDKEGQKMSKHKGNVIDPWEILDTEGADAVRWYFCANSHPWLPSRFSFEAVNEMKRKFIGTFWNTYAFYVLYANIDGFNPQQYQWADADLTIMDRWILSRLNSLIQEMHRRLGDYDITTAARALQDFTEELSNWYVRRGRERYWQKDMDRDKIAAYLTLYTVLESLARLSAPFTPFLAEDIYQNLVRSHDAAAPESVHFCLYPTVADDRIDAELEQQMKLVLDLVVLGRAARNSAGLKNRQPLASMKVAAPHRLGGEYIELVLDELNVQTLVWADDAADLQDFAFKPQLRLLGKKFGPKLPQLAKALSELDGQAAMAELKAKQTLSLDVAGETVVLTEEELIIEAKALSGYATEADHGLVVALDTRLTPELVREGQIREIVSKVQTMRKESGFEVTDRIELRYGENDVLRPVIAAAADRIAADVLATVVEYEAGLTGQAWDINGETLTLAVKRVQTNQP